MTFKHITFNSSFNGFFFKAHGSDTWKRKHKYGGFLYYMKIKMKDTIISRMKIRRFEAEMSKKMKKKRRKMDFHTR